MPARPTATMGLAGLRVDSSSALDPGITDIGDAAVGVLVTVTDAGLSADVDSSVDAGLSADADSSVDADSSADAASQDAARHRLSTAAADFTELAVAVSTAVAVATAAAAADTGKGSNRKLQRNKETKI